MSAYKKNAAQRHLAGIVVAYVLNGGSPSALLGKTLLGDSYELLRQALETVGWPEAAGIVQAWVSRQKPALYSLHQDAARNPKPKLKLKFKPSAKRVRQEACR